MFAYTFSSFSHGLSQNNSIFFVFVCYILGIKLNSGMRQRDRERVRKLYKMKMEFAEKQKQTKSVRVLAHLSLLTFYIQFIEMNL